MTKNILYASLSRLEYSVNVVYIKGLQDNGVTIHKLYLDRRGLKGCTELFREYWRKRRIIKAIIVGYDSPQLVVWARLVSGRRVIYNALCSAYERSIVSRAVAPVVSLRSFYYWLIDFVAVHLSDLVMLESNEQIKYFNKIFKVSKKKCFRAWTGVDESKFFYDPSLSKPETFTVIFRGGLLPESGAEYAIRAAKILEKEDINFIMHANDQELPKIKKLIDELKPVNFRLITEFLSDKNLRVLMQKSHLSLGQLSNHPRLRRTIPHKAYESLALGLPYLTANNRAIMELLKPGETCLICNPADPESLAKQIMWAKNHPYELKRIAENGRCLYEENLTAKILASNLLRQLP